MLTPGSMERKSGSGRTGEEWETLTSVPWTTDVSDVEAAKDSEAFGEIAPGTEGVGITDAGETWSIRGRWDGIGIPT